MEIFPLLHSDLGFVREIQPADWGDILPKHEFYLTTDYCFPLKLTDKNQNIGIGTAIIHKDTAWLAHIIVHQNFRNKGYGAIITKALIDLAQSKNRPTIYLLATDLGAPVYRKLGFMEEGDYGFYKGGAVLQQTIPNINIKPYSNQFMNQIFEMDLFISGEDRINQMNEHIHNSFIYLFDQIVQGVYFPDWGEGYIIANNEVAGIALMKQRFKTQEIAVLPDANRLAINFLLANNYKQFRTAKRMRLGDERKHFPAFVYNRISGQIG